MGFLFPEVALYFYKSTIWPRLKYCCHVGVGALSCYLEMLNKAQKGICRTVGSYLAACLEPLAHRRNVASLSLFYRYYFGRCSSEHAQLVPLPYSQGRSTRHSDRLHDFLSQFLDITRIFISIVSSLVQLDFGIICP